LEQLTADIVAALKTGVRPEIPADIYELGLIYKIDVDECAQRRGRDDADVAGLRGRRRDAGLGGERGGVGCGVGQVSVKLTFDPPWDKDRMSDEAKLALGMF